jgi:hypothetical protein
MSVKHGRVALARELGSEVWHLRVMGLWGRGIVGLDGVVRFGIQRTDVCHLSVKAVQRIPNVEETLVLRPSLASCVVPEADDA